MAGFQESRQSTIGLLPPSLNVGAAVLIPWRPRFVRPSCTTRRPGKESGATVSVSGASLRTLLVTLTLVGAHLLLPAVSAAHDTQKI